MSRLEIPIAIYDLIRQMNTVVRDAGKMPDQKRKALEALRKKFTGFSSPPKSVLKAISSEVRLIMKQCRDAESARILDELQRNPRAYFGKRQSPVKEQPVLGSLPVLPRISRYVRGLLRLDDR